MFRILSFGFRVFEILRGSMGKCKGSTGNHKGSIGICRGPGTP